VGLWCFGRERGGCGENHLPESPGEYQRVNLAVSKEERENQHNNEKENYASSEILRVRIGVAIVVGGMCAVTAFAAHTARAVALASNGGQFACKCLLEFVYVSLSVGGERLAGGGGG